MKIMNIKNTIIKVSLPIIAGLTMNSCSDFLDLKSLNDIVEEDFWNEEADVNNIVTGCYSAMQAQAVVDRMMAWGEFRSDNIVGGNNIEKDASLANIFQENINATNAYTSWGDFYNIINRCNIVMHYAPKVHAKDPNYSTSELAATIAEVSAIRDLCYFYLIRTFRDVPFTYEAYLDDSQQFAIPATSFDNVLDALIADLEKVQDDAVKKYPQTVSEDQTGLITQDAIHAMLCDMYLWKQDYNNAIKYADMVIESKMADYNKARNSSSSQSTSELIEGFPLIKDVSSTGSYYGTAYNSIFGTGNSSESIFELTFSSDNTMPANWAVSARYGNATTFPGFIKPADFIGTDIRDENFDVFVDKYDTRSYENIMPLSTSLFAVNKYAAPNVTVTISDNTPKLDMFSLYTEKYCHSNWIIYRLTDVMLMKAEALVEKVTDADYTGATTAADSSAITAANKTLSDSLLKEAFNIVYAINTRSNCSTTGKSSLRFNSYNTKSKMRDLVLDERQRELMFEGKRWFDLVRRSRRDGNTNYLSNEAADKGYENPTLVKSKLSRMDAIYWPYNNDEIKVNRFLVQNPAFNSGGSDSYKATK